MFHKSDKSMWASLKTVKEKWFFTRGWRVLWHFILLSYYVLWYSCIQIIVNTCNHTGLSHLLHQIKSRCADVDGQALVHIHTRTWQKLKIDKVQKSGFLFFLSLFFWTFQASSWSIYPSNIKSEWNQIDYSCLETELDDSTCLACRAACSYIRKHIFFVCKHWPHIKLDFCLKRKAVTCTVYIFYCFLCSRSKKLQQKCYIGTCWHFLLILFLDGFFFLH